MVTTNRLNSTAVEAAAIHVHLGGRDVLRGVDLHVDTGETVALLGPNGAGKTTLVDCLQGFRRPDQGAIRVLGADPWRASRDLRSRVGVVLQDTRLDADLSVVEFIDMTRGWYAESHSTARTLDSVGLTALAKQRVHRLSGGERRRLDLALAMMHRPEVVFLDEPTAGLDPLARREIWTLLEQLNQQGTSILLCSHDLVEVERLADRITILREGRVVADGTAADICAKHAQQTGDDFEEVYLNLLTSAPVGS